ncbi:MAG: DUF5106 domain-containing protein [Rikenellaceae bacterium]
MSSRLVFWLIVTTLLMGCGNVVSTQGDHSTNKIAMPTIPSAIVDVDSRREYLAQHYWDGVDFTDSLFLKNDSLVGCRVAGYIQVLMMNPPSVIERSVDQLLGRALSLGYEPFERLTSTFEDYLYNPNSPLRNEELYLYILRYTVERSALDDIYKIRPRRQLEMALRNRVGEEALDFEYTTLSGELSTLHATTTRYTLLFFNSATCSECLRVRRILSESETLKSMVSAGVMTILSIYPDANESEMLKDELSPHFIYALDTKGAIYKERLYDLRALPNIYLLDSTHRVVHKDIAIEKLLRYLPTQSER